VVNAVAPDGTVEGIEFPEKGFALAVQWHPESLSDRYEDHQKIFDAFVRYCEENK
jgi:putative glutamine amidotransferase